MKAMILAAGMGTRLKPWTDTHPKALVPVGGVPMLGRVIMNLRAQGFDTLVVNVHHFAGQIKDYLKANDFGVDIRISDESGRLLDTGGGLVHAGSLLGTDRRPFLVHNVDILSNARLGALMEAHELGGSSATLLVSDRDSSRKLLFDSNMILRGWHNANTGGYRPTGFEPKSDYKKLAFSGIYALSVGALDEMEGMFGTEPFPIMDYFLSPCRKAVVRGIGQPGLELADIGKPGTLARADRMYSCHD